MFESRVPCEALAYFTRSAGRCYGSDLYIVHRRRPSSLSTFVGVVLRRDGCSAAPDTGFTLCQQSRSGKVAATGRRRRIRQPHGLHRETCGNVGAGFAVLDGSRPSGRFAALGRCQSGADPEVHSPVVFMRRVATVPMPLIRSLSVSSDPNSCHVAGQLCRVGLVEVVC